MDYKCYTTPMRIYFVLGIIGIWFGYAFASRPSLQVHSFPIDFNQEQSLPAFLPKSKNPITEDISPFIDLNPQVSKQLEDGTPLIALKKDHFKTIDIPHFEVFGIDPSPINPQNLYNQFQTEFENKWGGKHFKDAFLKLSNQEVSMLNAQYRLNGFSLYRLIEDRVWTWPGWQEELLEHLQSGRNSNSCTTRAPSTLEIRYCYPKGKVCTPTEQTYNLQQDYIVEYEVSVIDTLLQSQVEIVPYQDQKWNGTNPTPFECTEVFTTSSTERHPEKVIAEKIAAMDIAPHLSDVEIQTVFAEELRQNHEDITNTLNTDINAHSFWYHPDQMEIHCPEAHIQQNGLVGLTLSKRQGCVVNKDGQTFLQDFEPKQVYSCEESSYFCRHIGTINQPPNEDAITLTVEIDHINPIGGHLDIQVYDSKHQLLQERREDIVHQTITTIFSGLPQDAYWITVQHQVLSEEGLQSTNGVSDGFGTSGTYLYNTAFSDIDGYMYNPYPDSRRTLHSYVSLQYPSMNHQDISD